MSRRILFQLSGSIAAFKACALISKLVQEGYEVQTVCTRSALEFIGPATLEGLTGKPVLSDLFERGHAMDHIHLVRENDLTLLCPASASTLGKLASGLADDLVSTLFLAHDLKDGAHPYWVVPAMNPSMYAHPATQRNLSVLREWGVRVLEPETGSVACGETGQGRMIEPEEIFTQIQNHFAQSPSPLTHLNLNGGTKGHVLVTSGATREPIDAVRVITNFSTGSTGAAIATALAQSGFEVTYLHGESATLPADSKIKCESFSSVIDLDQKLKHHLASPDLQALIHAAAVGDYHVASIESGTGQTWVASTELEKLPSSDTLFLKLEPNPKLVESVRRQAKNPGLKLIAFKLTHGTASAQAAVSDLFERSKADLIVHNHFSEVGSVAHRTTLYTRGRSTPEPIQSLENKRELANSLTAWLETEFQKERNL